MQITSQNLGYAVHREWWSIRYMNCTTSFSKFVKINNTKTINYRCCCKETSPTAWLNLNYFTRTILQVNKIGHKNSVRNEQAYDVWKVRIYRGLHDAVRTYARNHFAKFLGSLSYSAHGKKIVLSINFMEGFETSTECVCWCSFHSVVIW